MVWGQWRGRKLGREQEGLGLMDKKQEGDGREARGGQGREKSKPTGSGVGGQVRQVGPGQPSRAGVPLWEKHEGPGLVPCGFRTNPRACPANLSAHCLRGRLWSLALWLGSERTEGKGPRGRLRGARAGGGRNTLGGLRWLLAIEHSEETHQAFWLGRQQRRERETDPHLVGAKGHCSFHRIRLEFESRAGEPPSRAGPLPAAGAPQWTAGMVRARTELTFQ